MPPIIAPSIGSVVATIPKSANRSTKAELSAMPMNELNMKPAPKCRHAIAKSGTLRIIVIVPTGSFVSSLIIIAIPMMPPEVIEFGYMKNWKPTAYTAEPRIIMRNFSARPRVPFGALFRLIRFSFVYLFILFVHERQLLFRPVLALYERARRRDAAHPVARGVLNVAVLERQRPL